MAPTTIAEFAIRRAERSDVHAMAEAHRDSIRSIGAKFYSPRDVDAWQQAVAADVYLRAMTAGEVFFIATGNVTNVPLVLGFSSDYLIADTTHGTSVYVRGLAVRRGVGTALLRRAEAHATAGGGRSIRIEASLAGVEFYRANGYVETGRGETHLMSGYPLSCVFMLKQL